MLAVAAWYSLRSWRLLSTGGCTRSWLSVAKGWGIGARMWLRFDANGASRMTSTAATPSLTPERMGPTRGAAANVVPPKPEADRDARRSVEVVRGSSASSAKNDPIGPQRLARSG